MYVCESLQVLLVDSVVLMVLLCGRQKSAPVDVCGFQSQYCMCPHAVFPSCHVCDVFPCYSSHVLSLSLSLSFSLSCMHPQWESGTELAILLTRHLKQELIPVTKELLGKAAH